MKIAKNKRISKLLVNADLSNLVSSAPTKETILGQGQDLDDIDEISHSSFEDDIQQKSNVKSNAGNFRKSKTFKNSIQSRSISDSANFNEVESEQLRKESINTSIIDEENDNKAEMTFI